MAREPHSTGLSMVRASERWERSGLVGDVRGQGKLETGERLGELPCRECIYYIRNILLWYSKG